MPDEHRDIIVETLCRDWGITSPREFQIEVINRGAFFDDSVMYIVAGTGSGKSAIPLCISSLRRGMTVVLVPLLGLGSDQVAKALFVDRGIEAYHVDEHK